MSGTFYIGRMFGVPIYVHWTLLLFLFYIIYGGDVYRGIIFSLVLFGSILLHELGHIAGSKMMGGHGHEVILWPLGGLAISRQEEQKASSRFVVVLLGPLVSALLWGLGVLMLMATVYMAPKLSPKVLEFAVLFFNYMALINMWLLAFNMLPAFPMDGGQLLHSVIWMRYGRRTAARICAPLAGVIGLVFIAVAMNGHIILFLIALLVLRNAYQLWQSAADEADYSQHKRQQSFKQKAEEDERTHLHECAICGITEKTGSRPVFRVCSGCTGGLEYCQEHLADHEHRQA